MSERDEIVPVGPWRFDADVAAAFPDMISRSIPGYESMRSAIWEVAECAFAGIKDPCAADYGCSLGHDLPDMGGNRTVEWWLFDRAPEMCAAARHYMPDAQVHEWDLREGAPFHLGQHDLQLLVLTLQFVPVEHRLKVLTSARQNARPGGALVLVEKTLPSREMEWMLRKHKLREGYTMEQIEAKAASLENVLVPLSPAMNEQLLQDAGWDRVETFWARQSFRGWVAWA